MEEAFKITGITARFNRAQIAAEIIGQVFEILTEE